MKGLYLCAPHGSLIYEGKKTAIAIAAPLDIEGHRIICSKEEGIGLAFGIALIGEPALLDASSFADHEDEHRVPRSCRLKWWPDAEHLYHYPILNFQAFPAPVEIDVLPGTTMCMGEVEGVPDPFLGEDLGEEGKALEEDTQDKGSAQIETALAGERCSVPVSALMSSSPNRYLTLPGHQPELVIPAGSDTIMPTSPDARKEFAMPWKPEDATEHTKKADTPAKRKRWAAVANSALEKCKGDRKACEASAIRQANSVISGMKEVEDGTAKIVDAIIPQEPSRIEVLEAQIKALREEVSSFTKAGDLGLGSQGKVCTCPNCGFEVEGEAGVPCRSQECPKCGAKLQGGDGDDNDSQETPEDSPPPKSDDDPGDPKDEDPNDNPNNEGGDESEENEKPPQAAEEGQDEETEPDPNEDAMEPSQEEEQPSPEDPSNSITEFVIEKLRTVYSALSEFFKRETYQEKEPGLDTLYTAKGFKTLGTDSQGKTWFMLWPTNAYKDREGEIFSSKALRDYVDRHARQYPKGEAWYQHVKGSKFGTIWEQAVVANHFICQLGTYDDTPVGRAFKEFFSKYPDGHPTLAPHGWGASHQYDYIWEDRLDGVYEKFDIHESTVLPLHRAANIYNPTPMLGGMKMKDEEKTAFQTIGSEVGIDDLVDQVTAAGQEAKTALDARKVERKSKSEDTDKGETEDVKEEAPVEEQEQEQAQPVATPGIPNVVASIASRVTPRVESKEAKEETTPAPLETGQDATPETETSIAAQVAEELQLGQLSEVLESLGKSVKTLRDEVAAIQSTLADVTRSEEVKKAEMVQTLPRLSWMRASQAQETEIPSGAAQALKAKNADPIPDAVKGIAANIHA